MGAIVFCGVLKQIVATGLRVERYRFTCWPAAAFSASPSRHIARMALYPIGV